jgi:RNA polymerase sigma-70 factor (ECF subfamily)
VTAYKQYTDTRLSELLAQDDRAAFDAIYDRYWQVMYDHAYKRLRNKQQCREIIQDVFIDLWLRRGKVDINNIKAYLLTAVRFQIYKQVAKEKAGPAFFELYETMAVSFSGVETNLIEKEFMRFVKVWVDMLPEKRRKVFLMHVENDLSTKEIANQLSVSQKTVQNQLATATQSLRMYVANYFKYIIIEVILFLF